jgi:hypothetical protein
MAEIKYTMESHGMSIDIRYVLSPPPSHKQTTSGADPNPGSGFGIWIRDEQPGSYFRELKKQFFGLKYSNSFMGIRDPG